MAVTKTKEVHSLPERVLWFTLTSQILLPVHRMEAPAAFQVACSIC